MNLPHQSNQNTTLLLGGESTTLENFLSTKAEHEFNLVTSDLVTPLQGMSICFPRDTHNTVITGSNPVELPLLSSGVERIVMESRTLGVMVLCSGNERASAVCDSVEVHSPMFF